MSTEGPPASAEAGAERARADSRPHMAANFQVTTPEPFCFSRPEEWEKCFRIASGLASRDDEMQVNTLIYAMGDQADDILRSFELSEEDRKNYRVVKSKFDSYFVQRRNVIFERAKFNRRIQEEGESVDTFITALYSLAEHCGYGELHDEMIRDRIMVEIRNSALSEKLQLDSKLTLDIAIAQVRQREAVKQQQPLLRASPDTPVGAVHKGRGGSRAIRGGRRASLRVTNNRKTGVPGVASALPITKLSAQPETRSAATATSEVTTKLCAGLLLESEASAQAHKRKKEMLSLEQYQAPVTTTHGLWNCVSRGDQ